MPMAIIVRFWKGSDGWGLENLIFRSTGLTVSVAVISSVLLDHIASRLTVRRYRGCGTLLLMLGPQQMLRSHLQRLVP